MSFFKDFKNDLSMAVNNITPEGEPEIVTNDIPDLLEEELEQESESIILDDFVNDSKDPVFDEAALDNTEVSDVDSLIIDTVEETVEETAEEVDIKEPDEDQEYRVAEPVIIPGEIRNYEVENSDTEQAPVSVDDIVEKEEKENTIIGEEIKTMSEIDEKFANEPATDESAVITEGMKVTGDIISTGNMDVLGTVKGNIDIKGKLTITGSIEGNSKAAEIFADSAKITGDIESIGSVKVGQSSVIVGDISATSAVIAGAVKGSIDVHGPVILDTSAIVMGDIKSKSVQINNGAVIEGHCSQCYAEVSPTSFFNDVK